jgi:hypothetical protein
MSIFAPMRIEDIDHGRAERRVTINGKERVRGDPLSHADLASMATANRNALIENRMITVWPKSVQVRGPAADGPALAAVEGDYHIVTIGFGKYRVIKGVLLQDGVAKDAAAEYVATQLAREGKPAPQAAAAPAKRPSRPAVRRRKQPKRAKGSPPVPSQGSPGDNGPVE